MRPDLVKSVKQVANEKVHETEVITSLQKAEQTEKNQCTAMPALPWSAVTAMSCCMMQSVLHCGKKKIGITV